MLLLRSRQPHEIFLAAALVVGLVLRLREYLSDRSLWLDESYIALNVTRRSFGELLKAPAFAQAAPVGFLFSERLATKIFGTSEYALRSVSFSFSLIGLAAFAFLATRVLRPPAAMIAVGLFALSDALVRYASEVKPYGLDACMTSLVLLYIVPKLQGPRFTRRDAVAIAAVGAAAMLFSFPVVFVFFACGIVLGARAIARRDSRSIRNLLLGYGTWGVALVAYYIALVRSESRNESAIRDFQADYWPFPPHSVADVNWLPRHLLLVFSDPPGFVFSNPIAVRHILTGISALLFLAGCVSLHRRRPEMVWILVLPILFALGASADKKYVFGGRLLLFTIPALALLLGEGITAAVSRTRKSFTAAIAIGALAVVFAEPLAAAGRHLVTQRTVEETRPVLTYLLANQRPGDHIYVSYWTQFAFKYYASRYAFGPAVAKAMAEAPDAGLPIYFKKGVEYDPALASQPPTLIIGSISPSWQQAYAHDVSSLPSGRDWIVLSHASKSVEDFYVAHLDRIGSRLDTVRRPGATLFLYRIRRADASGG